MFGQIFEALAAERADLSTLMIDASHIKAHRIAAGGIKKHRRRAGDRADKRRAEHEAASGL